MPAPALRSPPAGAWRSRSGRRRCRCAADLRLLEERERAQRVGFYAVGGAFRIDEHPCDAEGGLGVLRGVAGELEAALVEAVGLAPIARHGAPASEHVAELVGGLAGGRERGGERVPPVDLFVVRIARAPVLVDAPQVDDALVAARVGGHLVELGGLRVVLLHQIVHVVERSEVVHARGGSVRDARPVAEHEHLGHLGMAPRHVADAAPVLVGVLGEPVSLRGEGGVGHLVQERLGVLAAADDVAIGERLLEAPSVSCSTNSMPDQIYG